MAADLLGKKLFFIVAHPDDESYLASGTAFRNRKAGGRNVIVCLTRGERGRSHLKAPHTALELKAIRTKELQNLSRFLKVKLHIFDFPDGKVTENIKRAYPKCRPLARRFKPDYIISFGPDGISGHLDHIATGAMSKELARDLHVPFVSFAAAPSLAKNIHHLNRRRKFGVYAPRLRHVRHNLKIAIDPKIKLKAIRFHKSQIERRNPISFRSAKIRNEIKHFEFFTLPKGRNGK